MDTNDVLARVARLSDHDLLALVKDLARREREATVALIVHLAELDERRLYLAEGYPSLFKYCTDVLRLSEHAAYNRIETARAVRHFPVLLEHLAAGWMTLFAVRRLAPHLTLENHCDVLALARYKTKQEIEELIARLHPQPPVPDVIRRLPARTPAARTAPNPAPLLVGGQQGRVRHGMTTRLKSPLPSPRLRRRRPPYFLGRLRDGQSSSVHSLPSATKCSLRPARNCTRSSERPRRSCGTRFRTAISRRSSIGPWRRC